MRSVNVPHGREVTLVCLIALALSFLGCGGRTNSGVPKVPSGAALTPAYPLKLSANRRYLLGQNGIPFLIVGDSPQSLMARLTEEEADHYFGNRQSHGFNTLGWIDVLCAGRDFPDNTNAATVDGIRPFLRYLPGGSDYTHYDLSKPNDAYFARLDHMVALAAKHGLFVFLAPAETNGWIPTLHHNGLNAAYAYGQYLGNRYKGFSNVGWLSGNDFVTWKDPKDDAVVQAVAKGIQSVDPDQLQTVELNYETSSSFDDPTWVPLISLNGTYTYSPTYMQMFHSYNQTPVAPVYLVEAHYDQENVGHPPDYGTPPTLRREEYWTMLSGGTGVFYGNFYTWSFSPGWKYYIDTAGVTQLTIWKNFFSSLPWYEFVPDQDHSTVTAGLGTYGTFDTHVSKSDFCTAARTADGSFVVSYLPTVRTIAVNMAALKAPAKARWFDPANGTYTPIAAEPFVNSGVRQFTPPQRNSDGDTDWVLLLDAS
jgi:Protein of unknown function (DUF4038)/Putative collagen-binding domain of a collagenase